MTLDFRLKTFNFQSGTGSCPWPPQGLQRDMRLSVSHPPLNGPCLFMASTPY